MHLIVYTDHAKVYLHKTRYVFDRIYDMYIWIIHTGFFESSAVLYLGAD